jgi:hypothetical protein
MELAKGPSYRFKLSVDKSAGDFRPPAIRSTGDEFTALDHGILALRLPKAGEMTFDPPLAMGQDHAAMVGGYGRPSSKDIAPGPIQGIRLAHGRWVGRTSFFAAKPGEAPRVTGYTCRITEQGPLFVEATIPYAFTHGGWYEFTAPVRRSR